MTEKNNEKPYPIWLQIILGLITFGIYFLFKKSYKKKSWWIEWSEAIFFAVIAATLIRTFLIEAFTIPTSSMEKSLLIGDFLFVSKVSYGARTPITPVAFPFVHHTMPFTDSVKSYTTAIKFPYFRLPGFGKIKNNDVVVFNYPMEDFRPVDKKENYIKRCVGIHGDSLEVRNGVLFINGKEVESPLNQQMKYYVKTDGSPLNPEALRRINITEAITDPENFTGDYQVLCTKTAAKILSEDFSNVVKVEPIIEKKGIQFSDIQVFPHSKLYNNNIDNFGPIYIPEEGKTVKLSLRTLPFYERIITTYEHHKLEVKDSVIYIDDKPSDSYTFQMNYYFMMGDNRHNSLDSRYWGYVPEDHIVGKAVFIWMSLDNLESNIIKKIRWNRLFTTIGNKGISGSYFAPVVVLILAGYGLNYYRKKKNATATAKKKK